MEVNIGVLVVANIKGVAALFSLIASIVTAVFLCYHRVYMRVLYRLFLCLLFTTILSSIALIFQTISVNILLLSDNNETWEESDLTDVLCTISSAFLNYTSWLDVFIITTIVMWLVRTTVKPTTFNKAVENSLKMTNQTKWKCCEFCCFFSITTIPLITIVPPVLAAKIGSIKGLWCQVGTLMVTNRTYEVNEGMDTLNIIRLLFWYVPTFVLLVLDTVLLIYCTSKLCWRLKTSFSFLRGQHKEVLKDGIALTLFIMIIYIVYFIQLMSALYFIVATESQIVFWGIEAIAIGIRGIAIIIMFFNSHRRSKIQQVEFGKVNTEPFSPGHTNPALCDNEDYTPAHMINSSYSFDRKLRLQESAFIQKHDILLSTSVQV